LIRQQLRLNHGEDRPFQGKAKNSAAGSFISLPLLYQIQTKKGNYK